MQFWADRITREQHICRHTVGEETHPVLLQDVKPGGNPSFPPSPPPPQSFYIVYRLKIRKLRDKKVLKKYIVHYRYSNKYSFVE
jgi:hypothetical protein